jgi:hypothetical protein
VGSGSIDKGFLKDIKHGIYYYAMTMRRYEHETKVLVYEYFN